MNVKDLFDELIMTSDPITANKVRDIEILIEKYIAELEAQALKVVKPQILPVLDRKCECGAALDYGVNYCNNCGAKLKWGDA